MMTHGRKGAAPDLFPVPHELADTLIPRGSVTTDQARVVAEAPANLQVTADEIWMAVRSAASPPPQHDG